MKLDAWRILVLESLCSEKNMRHATRILIFALALPVPAAFAGSCRSPDSAQYPADRVSFAFECRNELESLCVVRAFNALHGSQYYRVSGHSRFPWPLLASLDSPSASSSANEGEAAISLYHEPPPLLSGPKHRMEMIIQKESGNAVFIVERSRRGDRPTWETLIHESLRCKISE
jgi:hypothetical protein